MEPAAGPLCEVHGVVHEKMTTNSDRLLESIHVVKYSRGLDTDVDVMCQLD